MAEKQLVRITTGDPDKRGITKNSFAIYVTQEERQFLDRLVNKFKTFGITGETLIVVDIL